MPLECVYELRKNVNITSQFSLSLSVYGENIICVYKISIIKTEPVGLLETGACGKWLLPISKNRMQSEKDFNCGLRISPQMGCRLWGNQKDSDNIVSSPSIGLCRWLLTRGPCSMITHALGNFCHRGWTSCYMTVSGPQWPPVQSLMIRTSA